MTSMRDKAEAYAINFEHVAEGLPDQIEDARVASERALHKVSRFVRSNSSACLFGAFVVGLAFARMARFA